MTPSYLIQRPPSSGLMHAVRRGLLPPKDCQSVVRLHKPHAYGPLRADWIVNCSSARLDSRSVAGHPANSYKLRENRMEWAMGGHGSGRTSGRVMYRTSH